MQKWTGDLKKPYEGYTKKDEAPVANPRHTNLPEDVFQRIRQVDQQQSTLTSQGVIGFSARILDRSEYRLKQASDDVVIVQLVEIIKKPGQTLGLYLREGNGSDRPTGVFASRFGEQSELERYGDIIRPGDEIMTVNNVDVSQMSIDDVVLILSIPRRLLLRIRFLKNKRNEFRHTRMASSDKPVVVFQKLEEQKESANSSQTLLNKPLNTANTWLGKQAKQVGRQNEQMHQLAQKNMYNDPGSYNSDISSSSSTLLHQNPNIPSKSSEKMKLSFAPNLTTSTPHGTLSRHQDFKSGGSIMKPKISDQLDSVAETARVPPPRLLKQNSFTSAPTKDVSGLKNYGVIGQSNYKDDKNETYNYGLTPNMRAMTLGRVGNENVSGSSLLKKSLPINIRSAGAPSTSNVGQYNFANQFSNGFNYETSEVNQRSMPPYKSNSLPRRRFQLTTDKSNDASYLTGQRNAMLRNVKWRNDVVGGLSYESRINELEDFNNRENRRLNGASNINTHEYTDNSNFTIRNSMSQGTGSRSLGENYANTEGYGQLSSGGTTSRTINDIFSAREYRNWAGGSLVDAPTYKQNNYESASKYSEGSKSARGFYPTQSTATGHQSRWSGYDNQKYGSVLRSNSLPAKSFLAQISSDGGQSRFSDNIPLSTLSARTPQDAARFNLLSQNGLLKNSIESESVLDRLHISPIMNRKVALKAAGPGFDIDNAPPINSLTGILQIFISEGRNLKVPEELHTRQMYVVLEINEIHRARTGVSTHEQRYRWKEGFEIDVFNVKIAQFYVYSWHPQTRHKLCYKGTLKLLEAFMIDQLNGSRPIALNLEPRGQLMVRIGYKDINSIFRRLPNPNYESSFGIPLSQLVSKHNSKTPLLLGRLIQEIEARGVDAPGLYILCGSMDKKRILRIEMERCMINKVNCDISLTNVADINVLTCLAKDFLRELPEPLISSNVYSMLTDAESVFLPSDVEGNQKLVLKIIDCLPTAQKNTLILVLDHIKLVLNCGTHDILTQNRLIEIFAPLIFCASTLFSMGPIDITQACSAFRLLVNIWPPRMYKNGPFANENLNQHSLIPISDPVSESQC
uniref:Rho GTPase-activating protein 100F n=1 Tax=Rhabditophanes sp. KR3021 TaxID=114890 RepID=A0AC35U6J8_9BILA